jgi:hypothetical protein
MGLDVETVFKLPSWRKTKKITNLERRTTEKFTEVSGSNLVTSHNFNLLIVYLSLPRLSLQILHENLPEKKIVFL